jgi:alanyl-tRNA synthetase
MTSQPQASAKVTLRSTSGADIREAFLAYFEQELGHKRLPSASLIPTGDNKTVMLCPAGMLPFVPIFLGLEPTPNPPRATSSQKCARVSGKASDLENVGRTPRHHTFFEMLGNFSFGDYFKGEVIPWAWRFVTEVLGLPPERLWVSLFEGDDLTPADEEAAALWRSVGVPDERILRCSAKDNFWGPPGPTGPCGPCSEIHYQFDMTKSPHTHDIDDCLLEIWNLVFMEFFKDGEGKLTPLEKKNVDTGMGLERITTILQNKANTFETDLLFPILQAVASHCGVAYGASGDGDVALKIVTDHLRFLAFTLADGVVPSNEGRGYIVRMVLRRAVRYGKRYLGLNEPFLHLLLPQVTKLYGHAYPELVARETASQAILEREEKQFLDTLERGTKELEGIIDHIKGQHAELHGKVAFELYDTYGFPLELTKDILAEHGLGLDEEGFHTAMAEQKQRARAARKTDALVDDQALSHIFTEVGATPFIGYDTLEATVTVAALLVDGQPVAEVSGTNQPFSLILNQTPFYPESGGQVGDIGTLTQQTDGQLGLTVLMTDTQKQGQLIVHTALFDQGQRPLRVGDTLLAAVDEERRHLTALHHSATHLLHAALKRVLGEGIAQAGSHVAPDVARFDYSCPQPPTADQLEQVEALVNAWVMAGAPAEVEHLPLAEAKAKGAVAMFGEKYGDVVRVVRFGAHSLELCGGTHVANVSHIGLVKVLGDAAVASGVRRVTFIVGMAAYRAFKAHDRALQGMAQRLKAKPLEVADRLEALTDELKTRDKALAGLQTKLALAQAAPLVAQATATPAGQVARVAAQVADVDGEGLKALAQHVADKAARPVVVLLASVAPDDRVTLVCLVSEALTKEGYHAGKEVQRVAGLLGGKGGGKPTLAQGGAPTSAGLAEALGV